MNNFKKIFIFRYLRVLSVGVLIGAEGTALAQTPATPPLAPNDVSWLFPMPTQVADLNNLIPMRNLTTRNLHDPTIRDDVWSTSTFQRFLDIATSPFAQVAGSQIDLPA